MSFNFTAFGFNSNTFFTVNSVLNIALLLIVAFVIFLDVLCVIALLLAKTLKWQIRAVLINSITADLVSEVGTSILYIGYPLRANLVANVSSCRIADGFVTVGYLSTSAAEALYAIVVYTFIKYGIKRLKWYVIVIYISVSWVFHTTLGVLIPAEVIDFGNTVRYDSFCAYEPVFEDSFSLALSVSTTAETILGLSLVVTFCTLTYCYIKRNASEENTSIKKAVAKTLLYSTIKVSFRVVVSLVSVVILVGLSSNFSTRTATFIDTTYFYIMELVLQAIALLTPVTAILILKPLRDAFGEMKEKVCSCCCKRTSEQPVPPNLQMETIR